MSDIRSFFDNRKKNEVKVIEQKQPTPVVESSSTQNQQSIIDSVEPTILSANSVSSAINQSSIQLQSNILCDGVIPKDLENVITWKIGEGIPYLALVEVFETVSKYSGRLDKESAFTKFFRAVIATSPADMPALMYLSSNSISPAYEGLELGIGDSLLVKAICEATGRKKDAVEEDYKREGDLGVVALNSRASQKTLSFAAKPKPLLATFVLEQLRKITLTKGDNAQSRKVNIIKEIMVRCQGNEAKYVVRSLQGKLRIGTAEQTALVALAHAFATTPTSLVTHIIKEEYQNLDQLNYKKSNANSNFQELIDDDNIDKNEKFKKLYEFVAINEPEEARKLRMEGPNLRQEMKNELAVIVVKRAFSECPNVDAVVQALLNKPLYKLHQECQLKPGIPVGKLLFIFL